MIDDNNIQNKLQLRLKMIPDSYNPIKEAVIKYSKVDVTLLDDEFRIFNQPWIAPLKYAIYVFKKTPNEYFDIFENDTHIQIPSIYKEFLTELNGCFIFDYVLFGLTPSIYEGRGIDRSKVQCLDLGSANKHWKFEYKIDEDLFHIGGRSYSYSENLGYFMDFNGTVKSIRTCGEILNEWVDFSSFLKDEIQTVELNQTNGALLE